MPVSFSVIVPTYRRPALLARCLAALRAQSLSPEHYEIIVADDGADRAIEALVAAEAAKAACRLRYVPVVYTRGPAAARNAGARRADHEILAFTDDDCVPDPHWLESAAIAFDSGADAAWGSIRMPLPEVPTDYEKSESGLEHAVFVTANCFCRREIFWKVGGFDEEFTAAWREDSDLYFRLLRHAAAIRWVPAAQVVHPVRPAPWAVHFRMQRKSMYDALLFKKHPELFRRLIRPGCPWNYYAIVLFFLATVAFGLRGSTAAMALSALGWLGLTGVFCATRLRGTAHTLGHISEMAVTSLGLPFIAVFWRLYGAIRFRVLFF